MKYFKIKKNERAKIRRKFFFYKQLQREIDNAESKSNRYTFLFYLFRSLQIILTGTITVLSGSNAFRNIRSIDFGQTVLIIGAIVTALNAIDTLFQFESKMTTYKQMLFEFRAIRTDSVYDEGILPDNPDDPSKKIWKKD